MIMKKDDCVYLEKLCEFRWLNCSENHNRAQPDKCQADIVNPGLLHRRKPYSSRSLNHELLRLVGGRALFCIKE
jgi:hypothetical protein